VFWLFYQATPDNATNDAAQGRTGPRAAAHSYRRSRGCSR
jgi:hypothetical protein